MLRSLTISVKNATFLSNKFNANLSLVKYSTKFLRKEQMLILN